MLFVKKLPWTSLLLLLFTYGLFGWLIAAEDRKLAKDLLADVSLFLWLIGAVYSVLIALALTAPFAVIRNFYGSWLKSDTRAFISVIIGAFVAVIILRWIEVVTRILVLISAAGLVRLDLQTAAYSRFRSFGIIVTVSLIGYYLGVIMYQLMPVNGPQKVAAILRLP